MFFFSPSFEPHSPLEPQFLPRPTTNFESELDLLERLEEDRKRRLHNIANVAAKTPIGMGSNGGESSSSTTADGSGGPNTSNVVVVPGPTRSNSYHQHRYYPPPSQEAMASFIHRQDQLLRSPPSAPSTRRRQYRANRNRSSAPSEAAATPSSDINNHNLSHLSHSHISHNNQTTTSLDSSSISIQAPSFAAMTSPLFFHSPPLDPRGGGGGRQRNAWYAQQFQRFQETTSTTSPRDHVSGETLVTPRNFAFTDNNNSGAVEEGEDMVTPEDRGVSATPGHGHSEDVYSLRRRRRRREVDS